MTETVLQIDAFTKIPGQGNPAGVVLNGDNYITEEMQEIAKKIGFNETVFVCSSKLGDFKLRYFTPGHETPLCGHATMASVFALYEGKSNQKLIVETGAGLLSVQYISSSSEILMEQAEPKFLSFSGNKQELCESIGIALEDLDFDLPIQYGNTGSWTLLVPVKNKDVLDKMSPKSAQFPTVLKELPKSSIHPFALDEQQSDLFHARHFSSPHSGTVEDSVTGTASGVMGAYALNHIFLETPSKSFRVFQGKHLQREGVVNVHVTRSEDQKHKVSISGTACFNQLIEI
ncbi:PhzF family phenazine biosynthesis protein [Enterococcus sp. LJL99]